MSRPQHRPSRSWADRWPAVRTTLIYLAVGLAYIVLSDKLLQALVSNPQARDMIDIYKGIGYVFITAYLLYLLVDRDMRAVQAARRVCEASEKKYRLLLEHARDGIMTVDVETRVVLEANRQMEVLLGRPRDSFLGRPVDELHLPEEREEIRQQVAAHMAQPGRGHVELDYLRSDGSTVRVEASLREVAIDGQRVVMAILRDLTERREAQEKLRAQADVLDQIGDFITVTDLDGVITYTNAASARMLGRSKEELVGQPLGVYGEDTEHGAVQQEIVERTLAEGRWQGEVVNHDVQGNARILDCRTWIMRDAEGNPTALCGVSTDITGRREAKRQLEQEHDLLARIMDTSPAGITVVDTEGTITFANRQAERVLGLARDEAVQRRYNDPSWRITDYSGRPFPDAQLPFRQVLATGRPVRDVQHAVERPDGRRVLLSINAAPIFDETDAVSAVVANVIDVTARVRMEQELRESQRAISTLVSNLPGVVYRCLNDEHWTMEYISRGCSDLTGYQASQLQYNHEVAYADLIHPDDRETIERQINEAVKESDPFELRYRIRTAGGEEKWVWERGRAVGWPQGGPEVLEGFITDVSELVEAERRLRVTQASVDRASIGIYWIESDGRFSYANQAACDILECELPALLSMRVQDIAPDYPDDEFRELWRRAEREGHLAFETEVRTCAGALRPVEVQFDHVEYDGKAFGIAYVRDITERRQAEEDIRRYVDIVTNMQIGLYVYRLDDPEDDASLRMIMANPATERLTGAPTESLVGQRFDECFPGLRERGITEAYAEVVRTGESLDIERIDYGDDRVDKGSFSARAFPLPDRCVGVAFENTTERVQSEQRLRESEALLRLAFEHANDGINISEYDPETGKRTLVSCNQRYVEMSGYPREQLEAADDLSRLLYFPHTRDEFSHWHDHILRGQPFRGMASWRRPDNRENVLEWTAAPYRSDGRILIFGVDRDITERVHDEQERERLKEQLLQAQKLEAIGTLAGGVAHDFNNLLTGIIGYANLLKAESGVTDEVVAGADAIEGAARRGGQLTSQLLAFARKRKREDVVFSVHDGITQIADLLGRTLGETIDVQYDLRAADDVAKGDPGVIQQVVLNLAVNARDAMPEGGTLRIETDTERFDGDDAELATGLRPGLYIVLTVSDQGVGIPVDIQDRIFEPFFTTKDPGKGTGMGLSMVYGSVRDHGGSVEVESKPGQGTTFRVYLPLLGTEAEQQEDEAESAEAVRGSGRLLVVDDDPLVLSAASQMLRGLGYDVTTATNGQEALDMYRAAADRYDLVILDVIMPRLGGIDCFHALREFDPEVRVLLSTGYGVNEEARRMIDRRVLGLVEKPFGLVQLSRSVSSALRK